MPPEIMGSEPNPHLIPCLLDHCPGSFVTYGKDLMIGLDFLVPDIFLESVSYLLRDEYVLPLFPTLGVPERQFPAIDISGPQLQDLAYSHSASGHQFQHETVSGFDCCEDDFVDHVFFDDFPGNDGSCPEHLPHHRVVAGIAEIGIDIGSDEVEKG